MKYDASRDTYDRIKHFSKVLMQQGRVQVDADWNEQSDIIAHRAETEAADVIGLCGGPLHDAAFHIVSDVSQLTAEEQANSANQIVPGIKAPDFLISAGRYYVDGILCENESLTAYSLQPDLPHGTVLTAAGLYVVYLDVWRRHLTALDVPPIRETALGGPDTATRAKTVWQVKWVSAAKGGNCLTSPEYDQVTVAPTGTLIAREAPDPGSTSPCIVPPGAGYRGLGNQLYRIEVHAGGTALDIGGGGIVPVAATRVPNTNQLRFASGTLEEGQSVEIVSTKPGTNPLNGTLAQITAVDGRSKATLSLSKSSAGFDGFVIRPVNATYKWSRDNGVVVTAIENINGQEVTVHDLGPDAVLGFAEGQWVEILDDEHELKGIPGQLAQILTVDRAINLVTLSVAPAPLVTPNGVPDLSGHPKLRRWDGVGAIKINSADPGSGFADLENGVQVCFSAGTYRTGDYWTIPARTATADALFGNLEWPKDGTGTALAQLPFGIKHHYCRLAMLHWNGSTFTSIEDCRNLFPQITELTSLFYLSGDGQESLPGNPIPQLLQVGVFNGKWPVAGAHVRFSTTGLGRLAANPGALNANTTTNGVDVVTLADGVASCAWRLDPNVNNPDQQVQAFLLDANGVPMPPNATPVILFNGNLSIAAQVFYDPGPCPTLQGRDTVQKAVDQLSHLVSLYEVSGNNQEVMPNRFFSVPLTEIEKTPASIIAGRFDFKPIEALVVLAANDCGPVAGQRVRFKILAGSSGSLTATDPGGTPGNPIEVLTGTDGIAKANWTLGVWTPPDPLTIRQQVEASLVDEAAPSIASPATVRFTANLSVASQVAYDPAQCADLQKAGVTTVQQAIDALCKKSDPGIRVTKIVTSGNPKRPSETLQNDTLVAASRLIDGITITCDGSIAPGSFGMFPPPPTISFPNAASASPTCFVTLDLPYPLGTDRTFWDSPNIAGFAAQAPVIFGFQPLILSCLVSAQGNSIIWSPSEGVKGWLQPMLQTLSKSGITDRVLAHLTLKGNFIWAQDPNDQSLLYLDGEVFGVKSDNNRINLQLPTGNGRKGGDFEMWFWLFPGITLTAGQVGRGIGGTVKDPSGAPLPGIKVTVTPLPPVIAGSGPLTALTDAAGNFSVVVISSGTYEVQVDGASPVIVTIPIVNPTQ